MSELVEEHTVIAKRLLTRMIYTVMVIQALLVLFDGFPKTLSLIGIASHGVYLGNMRRFPIVKLSDPLFVLSCGMLRLAMLYWRWRPNYHSSCPRQPLYLLHPLLFPTKKPRPLYLRRSRRTYLHRDSILLRTLRMARPLCSVCKLVRE